VKTVEEVYARGVLAWAVKGIFFALGILLVAVPVLAILSGRRIKGFARVAANNRVVDLVTYWGHRQTPDSAEHRAGLLVEGIDEFITTSSKRSDDIVRILISFLETVRGNLRFCLNGRLSDFPVMVAPDVERALVRMNPYHRWILFVSIASPTLGFLGTVTGLIQATAHSLSKASVLTGVASALTTTFVGLIIMLVALLVDHWVEAREEGAKKRLFELVGMMNSFIFAPQSIDERQN